MLLFFSLSSDEVISMLESQGLCGEVLMKRKAGRERLSILKFTKDFKKNSPVRWQEWSCFSVSNGLKGNQCTVQFWNNLQRHRVLNVLENHGESWRVSGRTRWREPAQKKQSSFALTRLFCVSLKSGLKLWTYLKNKIDKKMTHSSRWSKSFLIWLEEKKEKGFYCVIF